MKKFVKAFIACAILFSSIFMVSRYPIIQSNVENYEHKNDQIDLENYIIRYSFRYALVSYIEINKIEDPSSLLEGVDNEIILKAFNDYVKDITISYKNRKDLIISATSGNQTISNTTIPEKTLLTYTINYDVNGNRSYESQNISHFSDMDIDYFLNPHFYSLNNDYFDEYIYTYLKDDEHVYDLLDEYDDYHLGNMIKDISVSFIVPDPIPENSTIYHELYDYYGSDLYVSNSIPYILILSGALCLLVLLIPYRLLTDKILEFIASCKFIFLALFWCIIEFYLGYFGAMLSTPLAKNEIETLYDFFGIFIYHNESTYALSVLVWVVFFTVMVFFAYMIKYLFHKGIKNYIKENTFTYWCYNLAKKSIDHLLYINFKESGLRLSILIPLFNAFVIVVITCIGKFISYYHPFGIICVLGVIYSIFIGRYIYLRYRNIQQDYITLSKHTDELASGNLNSEIIEDIGLFNPLRDDFNSIKNGFEKAVQEEVKSTNMRTELITNVSHDLKTPLTSLITYIDLMKDENNSPEKQKEYLEILDHNALRLKSMIQDLFDVSKANSGNLEVHKETVDLVSFIHQVQYECDDYLASKDLEFIYRLPDSFIKEVDIEKTYRILENLFINISKYALEHTRVYIEMQDDMIIIKNISKSILNFDEQHILERFVQGDSSRNSQGSGLGLAIVKSFMEIQGFGFTIETDADLFKAILKF